MSIIVPKSSLSRRRLLQISGLSGLGLMLNGCGTRMFSTEVGQAFEPLNESLQSLMLSQRPVPEFPRSAIDPDAKLLINTFGETPQIDPAKFKLSIAGEIANPMQLSLADLQKLPLNSLIMNHVCVEGWAAIVHWGGIRLRDLAALAQPKDSARYVYFKSADGYTESWDIASALHPQTLMVTQRNGKPLAVDNGAPVRLASPVKLGYKQSKWVTEITFTSQLKPSKGYWEDLGYEWFAGT
jgi:DMSO/TMAO reductase YedYZ molybdopterin-dependent catalytic subunit